MLGDLDCTHNFTQEQYLQTIYRASSEWTPPPIRNIKITKKSPTYNTQIL